MMQPAKDGIGTDGVRFFVAIVRQYLEWTTGNPKSPRILPLGRRHHAELVRKRFAASKELFRVLESVFLAGFIAVAVAVARSIV